MWAAFVRKLLDKYISNVSRWGTVVSLKYGVYFYFTRCLFLLIFLTIYMKVLGIVTITAFKIRFWIWFPLFNSPLFLQLLRAWRCEIDPVCSFYIQVRCWWCFGGVAWILPIEASMVCHRHVATSDQGKVYKPLSTGFIVHPQWTTIIQRHTHRSESFINFFLAHLYHPPA